MAYVAGKTYKVKIGSNEIQSFLTNVSQPLTKDALETTTMGDGSRDYIEGLKNATISLSGRFDGDGGASPIGVDKVLFDAYDTGGIVAFKLNPYGVSTFAAATPGYTGTAIVTNYEHGAAFDGVATFSATLQVTGAVTRATSGSY